MSRKICLVPGPTIVDEEVLKVHSQNYLSADLEEDFFVLYEKVQKQIQTIFHAPKCTVTIQSGEGMLGLWGAMKSVLKPGDSVLAVATGVFGYGIGEMAEQIGAKVEYVRFEYDEIADDFKRIREAARSCRPSLITLVHSETPSGTLNPLKEIGTIAAEVGALFYVDFVSSGCGVDIDVEECNIDLGLLGSQKVLSCPPDMTIVTVSEKAWKVIESVKYVGYDALLPFKTALERRYFPYTMNWHGTAALHASLNKLMKEGMDKVYKRHREVAEYCRARLVNMGLTLFPKKEEYCSPTVTAAYVPEHFTWSEFDKELRKENVILAGSYGKLDGKIFRIGHMGVQADLELVHEALDIIEAVIQDRWRQFSSRSSV